MADIYGSDISTFSVDDGLDPLFATITGERVPLELCARCLMTPLGSLEGAPDFGFDLTELVGKRVQSPAALSRIKARVKQALESGVEQVRSAEVASITGAGTADWTMSIRVTLATAPFTVVLGINNVTASILRATRG